jgi:hypothetical protein
MKKLFTLLCAAIVFVSINAQEINLAPQGTIIAKGYYITVNGEYSLVTTPSVSEANDLKLLIDGKTSTSVCSGWNAYLLDGYFIIDLGKEYIVTGFEVNDTATMGEDVSISSRFSTIFSKNTPPDEFLLQSGDYMTCDYGTNSKYVINNANRSTRCRYVLFYVWTDICDYSNTTLAYWEPTWLSEIKIFGYNPTENGITYNPVYTTATGTVTSTELKASSTEATKYAKILNTANAGKFQIDFSNYSAATGSVLSLYSGSLTGTQLAEFTSANPPTEPIVCNENVAIKYVSQSADSWSFSYKTITSDPATWLTKNKNVYYSAGNVGVNTDSPTEKLEVNGDIKADSLLVKAIKAKNIRCDTIRATRFLGDGTGLSGIYWKRVPSDTSKLYYLNGVNIGTSSDLKGLLNLDAGTKTDIDGKFLFKSSSSNNGQFQILNPTGTEASMSFIGKGTSFGTDPQSANGKSNVWVLGSSLWSTDGSLFGLGNAQYATNHNGNGRLLTITSSGNVGIGTTSTPRATLDVNGKLLATYGEFTYDLTVNGNFIPKGDIKLPINKTIQFGEQLDLSAGYFTIGVAGSCCFNTYADYRGNVYFRALNETGTGGIGGSTLALQKDGSVAIGTWEKYNNTVFDTQGYKLYVSGGILCDKVKVLANLPNSDYVFNTTYNLLPLSEVDNFIKTNKHLPGIPSAQDFKQNGYSIGDMDDLLLRKVEELTLYAIQLKKENDAQSKVNIALQQQLDELKKSLEQIKKTAK